ETMRHPAYNSHRAYWDYLRRLLLLPTPQALPGGLPILYVVGESHSLSAQGIAVRYREQEMRCEARWIPGCKQWHLGNEHSNRYKSKCERLIRELPARSTIFLAIGEIDCRHDEGVVQVAQKSPDKSLDEIIEGTVAGYMRYVDEIAARSDHRWIVQGVPAS